MSADLSGQVDHETCIWRYMDVGRFLALLKSRSLYFARTHELDDLWEAFQLPRIRREIFADALIAEEKVRKRIEGLQSPIAPRDPPERIAESLAEVWDNFTRQALVNCWHSNDAESIAMWKVYTNGAEGVAIRSTVGRLSSALKTSGYNFITAEVRYVDYEASDEAADSPASAWKFPQSTNPLASVFSKRKVFSHEREIRVVIDYLTNVAAQAPKDEAASVISLDLTMKGTGCPIPVDLGLLIEKIVVSPDYPSWAISALQDAVSAAGLSITIEQSAVLKKPLLNP